MNSQRIQFNRQGVAAFLLASLILALVAGLAWAGAEARVPPVSQPKWCRIVLTPRSLATLGRLPP